MAFRKSYLSRTALIRILLTGLLALVLIAIGRFLEHSIPAVERWIEQSGPLGPWLFIALFVLLTSAFFSTDALCFLGGALFNFWPGALFVSVATFLAASLMFLIGRYCAQSKVRALLQRHPRLLSIDAMLGRHELKLMFLLRLMPFPFALLNYGFSVSRVNFWPYLLAVSGMLFYHLALVYFGYAAKHIAKLAGQGAQQPVWHYAFLIGGALLIGFILFYVTRLARRTVNRFKNAGIADE